MKIMKKRMVWIALLALIIGALTAQIAFATDDNVDFEFRIFAYQSNGQEAKGRLRQTTHTDNPWKVKLTKSTEGAGTYATFWLTNDIGVTCSGDRKAKQGAGAYYTDTYTTASQRTVYLTGENNNWSTQAYTVTGIWDEETW